ncbi:MAG: cobaltochelatase subunit CobN [Acidobacteria bacterium]|nr:cobaltochelatase subunit CobN [Acidobacteriota bacterium]
MSGLYRDGMPEKMRLLDNATRLAGAALDDNAVKRYSASIAERLLGEGADAGTARKAAAARIFGPAPGSFGVGIAGMMESSRNGGDAGRVADAYLGSLNHAYSAALRGEQVNGNLKAQLANNRAVIPLPSHESVRRPRQRRNLSVRRRFERRQHHRRGPGAGIPCVQLTARRSGALRVNEGVPRP